MTATTVDFEKFCGKENYRFNTTHPFIKSGCRYATNTYIAIRQPVAENDTAKGEKPFPPVAALSVWKQFPLLRSSLPVVEMPPTTTKECEMCKFHECPECDGGGVVEWRGDYSDNCYEHECRFCDGTGEIGGKKAERVHVNNPVGSQQVCETCRGTKSVIVDDGLTVVVGVRLANKYLRLITELPGLRVQPDTALNTCGEPNGLLFEADDGIQGVLMSRLRPV